MKRRIAIAAALLAACSAPTLAQVATPAPVAGAGTLATATALVGAIRIEGVLDTMFRQITPLVSSSVMAAIEHEPSAPADIKARFADPVLRPKAQAILSEEILKAYHARYGELLGSVAREYAAMFSEADLQAALAFYRSPTGQRFIAAQPVLQAKMSEEGRKIGMAAGREAIPAAMKRIATLPLTETKP